MIGGIPPAATMYRQPWGTSVNAAPRAYDMSWPRVTLRLSRAIIRPRCGAGASSPMYRGWDKNALASVRECQRQGTGSTYDDHRCRADSEADNEPPDRHLCYREGGGLDH